MAKFNQKNGARYICPLCRQSLSITGTAISCENKHSFDIAKEGYVNLLPVQNKNSKNPGDSKLMITKRREFLSSGHYAPLMQALHKLYLDNTQDDCTVLDAGCGEGYYTHQYKSEFNTVYGVDISKEAVKMAAKSYKLCLFAVASVYDLPFNDNFFDWVNSIYAPISFDEMHRVVQPGGYLISVLPGENHLAELKPFLYKSPKAHKVEPQLATNFRLMSEQKLSYPMLLNNGEQALDLIQMTPFAFKLTSETKQRILDLSAPHVTADFIIRLYQKD